MVVVVVVVVVLVGAVSHEFAGAAVAAVAVVEVAGVMSVAASFVGAALLAEAVDKSIGEVAEVISREEEAEAVRDAAPVLLGVICRACSARLSCIA